MEMNKRAYEKPETEVVEIATAQILCFSGGNEQDGAPRMDEVDDNI